MDRIYRKPTKEKEKTSEVQGKSPLNFLYKILSQGVVGNLTENTIQST